MWPCGASSKLMLHRRPINEPRDGHTRSGGLDHADEDAMTHLRRIRRVVILILLALLLGCADLAIRSAPPKTVQPSTTGLAATAVKTFWENFYEAQYEKISEILFLLTAAYLENPNDPQVALLLAHTHFWKVSERARLDSIDPRITDHLILAERYFEEARRLTSADDRIPGWLGAVKMALGQIHQDERLKREGYFMAKAAKAAYPHFNGFSFSYPLIRQPYDSTRFKEAVESIWNNTELCAERTFNRSRPVFDYGQLSRLKTTTGLTRVCWNTPLVPHNFEGFFLHLGDVLLKNGQKEAAEAAYGVIKQSPDYHTWRYKAALEDRLANGEDWSRRMRDKDLENDPPYMFNSTIACVVCHAK